MTGQQVYWLINLLLLLLLRINTTTITIATFKNEQSDKIITKITFYSLNKKKNSKDEKSFVTVLLMAIYSFLMFAETLEI